MIVTIKDLEFKTIVGVLPEERDIKQRVVINLEISYEYSEGNFINYADVAILIEELFQKEKFEILEDALEKTFKILKRTYKNIDSLSMEITKPDIVKNAIVGVKNTISFNNL